MDYGFLYVVATPIGNLGDITIRALETLKSVENIACEDTRVTGKLLNHFGIKQKNLISYYDQIEEEKSDHILNNLLLVGKDVVLVSDAGTPCINDPGYRLISKAHELSIKVIPIPGASALTSGMSSSGLPMARVFFSGFLNPKKTKREKEILEWKSLNATIAIYVPAREILATLKQVGHFYEKAKVCVAREITKNFEEISTDFIDLVIERYQKKEIVKGEATLLIDLSSCNEHSEEEKIDAIRAKAIKWFSEGLRQKEILKKLEGLGLTRNELYDLLIKIKQELN